MLVVVVVVGPVLVAVAMRLTGRRQLGGGMSMVALDVTIRVVAPPKVFRIEIRYQQALAVVPAIF